MFNTPIKHTRLTTMDEVRKFSFLTNRRNATPMKKWQNNGQIAYSDEYGNVFVTPYRSEIHGILKDAGYTESALYVPFSNGEERPVTYQWLEKIAYEENWAETHEEAFKIASEKGIKPVVVEEKYQVREISFYNDTENHATYAALTTKYLLNQSKENIGTYIVVDQKTLVICDEYGRTFLVKAKTIINDLVNALIDAGYTRTAHPERYIQTYKPAEEQKD